MKKILIFVLVLFCTYLFSSSKVMDIDGNVYDIVQTYVNENPSLQILGFLSNKSKLLINVAFTEDPAKEEFANLLYSPNSKNIFIIYTKERNDGSDLFLQVMHKDFTFSGPYLISEGSSNTYCINPKIYQTYKFTQDENGNMSFLKLLHIIWWEKGEREGAVYANIPVVFGNIDIEAKTVIHLNDLVSLDPKNFEGEISPYLYEYPEIFITNPNENKLTLLFSDLPSLSYIILDFSYDGEDTLRDRAHFPDIGVRMPISIPTSISLQSAPTFLMGTENKLALLMQNNETFDFINYCNGWSPLTRIASANDFYEAKDFVKRIIEDPTF